MVSLDGKPVSSMKVVDLKDELKKRGLSAVGLKKDLVERLEATILEEEQKQDGGDVPEPEIATDTSPAVVEVSDEAEVSVPAEEKEAVLTKPEEASKPVEIPQEASELVEKFSAKDEDDQAVDAPKPSTAAVEPEEVTGEGEDKAGEENLPTQEITIEPIPETTVAMSDDAVPELGEGKVEDNEGNIAGDVTKSLKETPEGDALVAEDWVLVSHPTGEAAEEVATMMIETAAGPEETLVASGGDDSGAPPVSDEAAAVVADVDMAGPEEVGKAEAMETAQVPLGTSEEEKKVVSPTQVQKEAAVKVERTPPAGSKRKDEEAREGDDSTSKRLKRFSTDTPPTTHAGERAKEGSGSGGKARQDMKLFPTGSARHSSETGPLRPSDKSNGAGSGVRQVPPPNRSPTASLLISNFLRPFTDKALKELLAKTGTVEKLWLASIKTHCYVTFSSVEEAEATRNALHNLQWPPQHGKLLQVNFAEAADVDNAVEKGTAGPVPAVPTPAVGQTAPGNVPPAPRLASPVLPPPPRERLPPPKREPEPVLPSLDDLFKKTKSKPHLYFLPLTDEQVAAKLDARKAIADVKRPGAEKGRK